MHAKRIFMTAMHQIVINDRLTLVDSKNVGKRERIIHLISNLTDGKMSGKDIYCSSTINEDQFRDNSLCASFMNMGRPGESELFVPTSSSNEKSCILLIKKNFKIHSLDAFRGSEIS